MKTNGSWVLWLTAHLVLLFSTRNPIYILVTLAGLLLSGSRITQKKNRSFWLLQNLRFLLTMVALSTLINALFTHTGDSILFTLPESWLLIGGVITLESSVYGAINGLVIGALYLLFNVLNQALTIKQTIHLIPRAFYPLAMTITVALTFFPSIQQRTREIKEAQMIRGNRMKKIKDWLPLLIPLLVTSLESAILLSESMTARGFHVRQGSKTANIMVIGLVLAAFAVFSGWILKLYGYPDWLSLLLYILGGLLLITILTYAGRQTKITRFHQEVWHLKDVLASIFFTLLISGFVILRMKNTLPSLSYSPYPILSAPTVQWVGVIFCFSAMLPALLKTND